jgi:hypothetical protein
MATRKLMLRCGMDGGRTVMEASQELDLPVFEIGVCVGIADVQHLFLSERDSVKRFRILVN